ncbi:hypothetical protein HD806DRAFT_519210 [Xylariaceae sp. AK1471]|nr:hypothetical protein HD806DRAFT_519210 [Xylariaceae sp. AK1471]
MSYQELLSETVVNSCPFEGTFDKLHDTPFMGLHTSALRVTKSPYMNGPSLLRELLHSSTVALIIPLFQFGGIGPLLSSLHGENTVVLPWPGTRLTPANVTAMLWPANYTTEFIFPGIKEAIVGYLPALQTLGQLKPVGYSGGAVNPISGKELAKHIRQFSPILGGTKGDQFMPYHQGIVHIGTPSKHRTANLFSPVEGQGGWWVYRGRADNWMTLSTGLRVNHTDMENTVSPHPDVRGALITGSFRFQPCLLVELKQLPVGQAATLWPTIAEANQEAPKVGRIPRVC